MCHVVHLEIRIRNYKSFIVIVFAYTKIGLVICNTCELALYVSYRLCAPSMPLLWRE